MKFAGIIAISTLFFSVAIAAVEFSYGDQAAWPSLNGSFCGGTRQSPIDIVAADVEESEELQALVFNSVWDEPVNGNLTNTHHSVKFDPVWSGATTVNHRGTYNLAQFHFHWGVSNAMGSEHLVSNERFSAEVHFVHTKQGGQTTDGDYYSVVSVLCEVTNDLATGIWENLRSNLPTSYADNVNSVSDIRPSDLLPDDRDYYYYMGSLTTPLCDETVQWFVLKETIEIPASVLAAFRTVETDETGALLTTNFRDAQALNGRVVQTPESGSATAVATSVALISAFAAVAAAV